MQHAAFHDEHAQLDDAHPTGGNGIARAHDQAGGAGVQRVQDKGPGAHPGMASSLFGVGERRLAQDKGALGLDGDHVERRRTKLQKNAELYLR